MRLVLIALLLTYLLIKNINAQYFKYCTSRTTFPDNTYFMFLAGKQHAWLVPQF